MVIYYVNVGLLPKLKAEKYIKECSKALRKTLGKKTKLFVIPVRHRDSSIEYLHLS